jgi:predicted nucleic acid-binding Zn ribbon protein
MASPRTFACPVCGEDVPIKAKACPHCGACEKSGWNQDATETDGLDLPGEDFDYDKFTEEEFGEPRKRAGKELMWWITAVVLLVLIMVTSCYNLLFR